MTSAKSCNSGFRSLPSAAAGTSRSNGLDVNSMNSRKPTLTRPSTPRTRLLYGSGMLRLKAATATDQVASIVPHSSSEPSWPPQAAAIR